MMIEGGEPLVDVTDDRSIGPYPRWGVIGLLSVATWRIFSGLSIPGVTSDALARARPRLDVGNDQGPTRDARAAASRCPSRSSVQKRSREPTRPPRSSVSSADPLA